MSLSMFTLVSYNGTNIGNIYLEDCGKRHQLGGSEQFNIGQDIIIEPGDVIALVNSGEVLTSEQYGILKTWSTANSTKVAAILVGDPGTAPGTNATLGTGGAVFFNGNGYTGTQAYLNGGVTGLSAPLTLIPSDGITGIIRAGITGKANSRGFYKANSPITQGDF